MWASLAAGTHTLPRCGTEFLKNYFSDPDAFLFKIAQPLGNTAAANTTFTTSPSKNGTTPTMKAFIGVVLSAINHSHPKSKITADPMTIDAAALRNFRSQPFSANAPVTYAAAGNEMR